MGFTKPGFAQKLTLPSLCHQLQDCAIGTPHKQCTASLPPARQGQVQQGLFYRPQASLGNTSQDCGSHCCIWVCSRCNTTPNA
jgi:hypothetical protein